VGHNFARDCRHPGGIQYRVEVYALLCYRERLMEKNWAEAGLGIV
jgi:hypothetical protein